MLVSSPDADWSLFEDPDEPTCGQRSASYGTLAESPEVDRKLLDKFIFEFTDEPLEIKEHAEAGLLH